MNRGTFEERLAEGQEREAQVVDQLQRKFWSVIPATEAQDRADKIDCWVRWKGVSYSVAIKWRDSGRDLGIAAVRPYDAEAFPEQWKHHAWNWPEGSETVPWDRDAQHYADLYAIGSDDGLTVVTGASVRRVVTMALGDLARLGILRHPEGHWDIRVVTDRGASGYSSGQQKLIVYIPLDSLERIEV